MIPLPRYSVRTVNIWFLHLPVILIRLMDRWNGTMSIIICTGFYLTLLSKDTPSPFIEKDAEVAVTKRIKEKYIG